jgi:hypothetical protein
MISYSTVIHKFGKMGEKTGWSYIEVPADVAEELNPGVRKGYQVKGFLDEFRIERVALLPMGDGKFIIPMNDKFRKGTGKKEGAMLQVRLELDKSEFVYPEDIMQCLSDDPQAYDYFMGLPESHRKYYIKWIESAKTEHTRAKRIAQTVIGCSRRMDYGQMLRELKDISI